MTLAGTLVVIGYALVTIGGLWIVVEAWQVGILWGLGSLFVLPIELIFVALHWKKGKGGFLLQVLGVVVVIIGDAMRQT